MSASPKIKRRNKKRETINKGIKFGSVKEMSGQAYDADEPLIVHAAEGEVLRRRCSETRIITSMTKGI